MKGRRQGRRSRPRSKPCLAAAPTPQLIGIGPPQRSTMAAVRIAFTCFGVRKSLNTEQTAQAADMFGAEGSCLSADKKLIDTSPAAFKAMTSVRSSIQQYWRAMTVPYPEPGITLIRRDEIQMFDIKLASLRQVLEEAVAVLDEHHADLKAAAQRRLGSLYSANDYPATLAGLLYGGLGVPESA